MSTLSAKITKVEESVETTALVFYIESVLKSPASGRLVWLKRDGERVKKGSIVAKVGERAVLAETAGILFHEVDDLANLWRLDEAWNRGWLNFPLGGSTKVEDGLMVKAGVPIGSIRDNLNIDLLVRVKREDFVPKWYDDKRVLLVFPSLGEERVAKVLRVKPLDNEILMHFRLVGWDNLPKFRSISVKLVKRRLSGVVIPINAIIIKEGKSGVYLVRGGRVFFKEIKFKELSSAVAITLDLKEGDRVVVEPDRVSEGVFVRW